MWLIGITGAIGHGKSTLADILVGLEPHSIHLESFYVIADVVNAWQAATKQPPSPDDIGSLNDWIKLLPPILKEQVGCECGYEQIKLDSEHMASNPAEYEKLLAYTRTLKDRPELLKQKITEENKNDYRPILQWIGGYLPKKSDPGLWYKELVARAGQAAKDGKRLCVIGGVRYPADADIICDAGGTVIKIFRPDAEQPDLLDPTERERDSIQVNTTIINDGDLDDLRTCAKMMIKDLRTRTLKLQYNTKAT